MKSKIFFTLIAIFSVSISTDLFGQEKSSVVSDAQAINEVLPDPVKGEQSPGAAISPLKKLQSAPFTGVLLSPLAVAKLIADLETREEEQKIEVEAAVSKAEATCTYEKTVLQNTIVAEGKISAAQLKAKEQEIIAIEKALEKELDTRHDPLVWGLLGLAAGVVATTATATIITYTLR